MHKVQVSMIGVFGLMIALALNSEALARELAEQESSPVVYTEAQASAGRTVYAEYCSLCHGTVLQKWRSGYGTSPSLVGPEFIADWGQPDRTLDDLFYLTRTTMPRGAGNSLPVQWYVDVIAFILQQNGYPAGNEALSGESALLSSIRLESGVTTQTVEAELPPTFIQGDDGIKPIEGLPRGEDLDIAAINTVSEQAREAYMARDWDRFSGFFTEDAIWMPGNLLPLTGKAEWWSFVERFWNSTAVEEMDLVTEEVIIAGDWAFERHTETTVTVRTAGDGEPSTSRFKGVWLLHREADGSWKIKRYIWNRNPGPN